AALDCARLPATVLSSVLSETGPGTRYLIEPSLLPRDIQAQLSAQLTENQQDGGWRIIAGSSTDPKEEIRAGRLTEEFYCSLSTLLLALPPLRERLADLPVLVERFLERVNLGTERPIAKLTP